MARRSAGARTEPVNPPGPPSSDDPEAGPRDVLHTLNVIDGCATDLAHDLETFEERVAKAPMHTLEARLAEETAALHDALEGVVPGGAVVVGGFPLLVQRALSRLRQQLRSWVDRWGWHDLIGPDREGYVAQRRERYRRAVEIPYYRAALTYSMGLSDDSTRDRAAFKDAEIARERGLSPYRGMTPEEALRRVEDLAEQRRSKLVLGRKRPSSTRDELGRFREDVREIADHVGARNRRETWRTGRPAGREPSAEPAADTPPAGPAGGDKDVEPPRPVWDRDTRTLSFNGEVCIVLKRSNTNIEKLIDSFDSKGWPPSIPNPFENEVKLHDTIKSYKKSSGFTNRIDFHRNIQRAAWKPIVGDDAGRNHLPPQLPNNP